MSIYDPHLDWGLFNIEKLTKNSEAVIVGLPAKNRCKLSTDGQLIATDYVQQKKLLLDSDSGEDE